MDIALAIEALVPAAQYGGSTTANERACYDVLRWEDERKKPTWKELETAWVALEPTLPDPEVEAKIAAEMARITAERDRAQAVDNLKARGDLPSSYEEL